MLPINQVIRIKTHPARPRAPRVPLVVLALHDIYTYHCSAQKYQMFTPECNKTVSQKYVL